MMIDEDKHLQNVSKNSWWGECQIAGELLASAFVNHDEYEEYTVHNHYLQYV